MDGTTSYIGRHRGVIPALIRVSPDLVLSEGIYRHRSGSTGAFWYSTTGNDWHASPEAAIKAGRS